MKALARLALCASVLTLASCAAVKTDITTLQPEVGKHREALPVAGDLAIYLTPTETVEVFAIPTSSGRPYPHMTGLSLREVSVEIGKKYFKSASLFDSRKKASYVLKISSDPNMTPAPVFSVDLVGTLFTASGKKIWSGKKSATSPGGSFYDEHAFYNVYAEAYKKMLDEIVKKKFSTLQTIAENSSPQIVNFKSSSKNLQVFSTGTGFFVNDSGVVATNNHVVERCLAMTVVHDGKKYDAKPIIADAESDVALIKIESRGNAYARILPNDANLRLGSRVLTLGYPLNGIISSSVNLTSGNISALSGPPQSKNLIQITAPIQPGNSGGPVVDSVGTVVGIVQGKLNAFRLARATGDIAQNVNFAVRVQPLRSLITESGVSINDNQVAPSGNLDTPDIAEQSAKYTVQLQCKG